MPFFARTISQQGRGKKKKREKRYPSFAEKEQMLKNRFLEITVSLSQKCN